MAVQTDSKAQARILSLETKGSLKRRTNPIKAMLKIMLLYLPLIIWTLITIYPFWYMIVVSAKSQAQIFTFPPPMSLDSDFFVQFTNNYRSLLSKIPFWQNLWNSIYIACMSTLLSIFFCSLGGYGFAMYNFRGKNIMFSIMIFTLMIPQLIGIIPYFLLMKAFGWLNTARAIYIPGIANAFGIFLMKQYIEASIPIDLVDAARVDGAGEFSIFWKIVFPLITPVIGSFGIMTFLGSWNNFLGPLVIMRSRETYTIPVALNSLRGLQNVDYGAIMVGTVISVFPLVLVFILMSKLIISKMTEGALKG